MQGRILGHYEILEPLGAGGMGEVYRARDTKLERDVAIKVLPEDFALDQERLARFDREAKVLASLNHANIAAIYGLEDFDGVRFIVMELVEGDALAERLGTAGRIEVDEALEIARQTAEALEAAHESGVIHRDLKPANVKVTPDGKVKVLDFGLAKAYEADGSPSEISPDLSQSPTVAAATRTGVILGTAAYMSPEQARGRPLDKRTDIWAFGCVLYEMLTGRRAFEGETVSDTMAAILKEEPDWGQVPTSIPWSVQQLLRRCLQKDSHSRLRDIGDARIEIVGVLNSELGPGPASIAESSLGPGSIYRRSGWVAASFIVGFLIAALLLWTTRPWGDTGTEGSLYHFELELPGLIPTGPEVALSPDGRQIVYAGRNERGEVILLHRRVSDSQIRPLEGTRAANYPFFSPDGTWVGFHAQGELRKVSLSGGLPEPICEVAETWGASWGRNNVVVFGTPGGGLLAIPASGGGKPEPVTSLNREAGETAHRWPQILPDGDRVVFTVWRESVDEAQVATISLSSPNEPHKILTSGTNPRIAPTGHLLFVRRDVLMADSFHAEDGRLGDRPFVVDEDMYLGVLGKAAFDVSTEGTHIRLNKGAGNALLSSTLSWVDRAGNVARVISDGSLGWTQPAFSRTGRRLASARFFADGSVKIWALDLRSHRIMPIDLEPDAQVSLWPVWSPDEEWIAAVSTRHGGQWNVYRWKADGSGEYQRLTFSEEARQVPTSWSTDDVIAFEQGSIGHRDIWLLRFGEEGSPLEPEPFLVDGRFHERGAKFSPDGQWIAFTSDRSNQDEVWVKAVQGENVPRQVSIDGGREPAWSSDGTELFYRSGDRMMAVAVTQGSTLEFDSPELLFTGSFTYGYVDWALNYDVFPDGDRFVMVQEPPASQRRLQVFLNWSSELEALASARPRQ
jgi:Tol biopolymer transport system component